MTHRRLPSIVLVLFALTRPLRVNVDEIVIKALAQSYPTRIVREPEAT